MALLTSLLVKVYSLVMALVLTLLPGGSLAEKPIEPTNPSALKMNFSVLSDSHIESYELFKFQYLRRAFLDIKRAAPPSDALVMLGDNTENGQFWEHLNVHAIHSLWNPSKNTLWVLGNHDIAGMPIEKAVNRQKLFTKHENPHFSQVINGYTLIVLASEDKGVESTMSKTQVDWLDSELAKAAAAGKPIFVFNHHPVYRINLQEDIFNTLKKYDDVVYFSGHMHHPAGVETQEGVTFVNVPCFWLKDQGGKGFYVEVYENEIILRVREYVNGQWASDHPIKIEL